MTAARLTRVGPYESTYTAEPTADGWTRFTVLGAKGLTAPWLLLLVGIVWGGYIGWDLYHGALQNTILGVILGFILAGCYVFSRAGSLATFRRRRAPAGTFSAGPEGVRLRNGKVIAAGRIRRITYRNVQNGGVTLFAGGTGVAGGLAVIGAARHSADGETYAPISYQLELEADGRAIPIVGCLTLPTAQALFEHVSSVLGRRSP